MENKTQCSGNCLNCNPTQRLYCTSQMAYNIQNIVSEIKELLYKKEEDTIIPINNENNESTMINSESTNNNV